MRDSKIQWTEHTWNPTRGCSLALMPGPDGKPILREGCRECYAKMVGARFSGPGLPYEGFAMFQGQTAYWTGKVSVIQSKVEDPLHWREPAMIFVDSMSDLFHDELTDLEIIQIIAVMALAHWHTFQVLTKRIERMQRLLSDVEFWEAVKAAVNFIQQDWNNRHRAAQQLAVAGFEVPLKNVWWGASIENQRSADYVIPFLLRTPAYVRWISAEPLLEETDISRFLWGPETICANCPKDADCECGWQTRKELGLPTLDWAVVGCESGERARRGDPHWIDVFVKTCAAAGLPLFVKQLGQKIIATKKYTPRESWPKPGSVGAYNLNDTYRVYLGDKKGGNIEEWPESLRVRQWPARGM